MWEHQEQAIKQILLEEFGTDKKKVVPCQINGWLETNQKKKEEGNGRKRKTIYSVAQSLDDIVKAGKSHHRFKLNSKQSRANMTLIEEKGKRASTCQSSKFRWKENIVEQCRQPLTEEIKGFNLNTIDPSQKGKRESIKRNSRGYVLNEMRRKQKQKHHIRQYSCNKDQLQKQNLGSFNMQQSLDFLHKKFRIVPVANRPFHQRSFLNCRM